MLSLDEERRGVWGVVLPWRATRRATSNTTENATNSRKTAVISTAAIFGRYIQRSSQAPMGACPGKDREVRRAVRPGDMYMLSA